MENPQHKKSTKLKLMQRFFSIAGNVAPKTSLLIMAKLVFTPQKRELKPPHIALIKASEKMIFPVGQLIKPRNKRNVKYYRWGSGEKTVFLIHGWDGMALDFYKIIPELVSEGYCVIAMDGPAHGGSEGETTNTIDFKYVMEQFFKKHGTPYAIIGHSMGGAASAFMLMESEFRIPRLVMITAPIIAKNFFEGVFQLLSIPEKMQKVLYKNIQKVMGHPIDYLDMLQRTDEIKADKILFVYDENDTDVPYKDIRAFLDKNKHIIGFSDDSGHNKVIRSKPVINEIIRFLK